MKKQLNMSKIVKENLGFISFILLLCMSRSSLADWYVVPTGSMQPTIVEGDRVLVNKMAYRLEIPFTDIGLVTLNEPKRGDIVIINSDAADLRLIKRVIGVPGDTVALTNNQLVINGHKLAYEAADDQPYQAIESLPGKTHAILRLPATQALDHFSRVKVPEGQYLVMGDNRNHSADSRVYGFVPASEIQGQALRVLVSLDSNKYFMPRTERFLEDLI